MMRSFFERLPKDRLLHGNEDLFRQALQGQEGMRSYTISSSGARLTYPHAVEVLTRFAHSLVRELLCCTVDLLVTKLQAIRE